MKLFTKLPNAQKLFSKVSNDPNLFRKAKNTARKVDNSIAKIGHFLSSSASSAGLDALRPAINGVVTATHAIRGNLERAIDRKPAELRNELATPLNYS